MSAGPVQATGTAAQNSMSGGGEAALQYLEAYVNRISIGSWAYSIGPYQANPVPFDEVMDRVAPLGFDGIELGGFPPHPNPDDLPTVEQRLTLSKAVREKGLQWSGLAADLWSQKLINTDDSGPYIA